MRVDTRPARPQVPTAPRGKAHWDQVAQRAAEGLWPEWSKYLANRWARLSRGRV